MKENSKNIGKAKQFTRAITLTVAGALVSKPRDLIRLAAHAGDEMLKGEVSQALHDTYAYFINCGKIPKEYFDSTKFADLAPEFGKLYRGSYSIEQLDALRKIFANLAIKAEKADNLKHLLDIALEMSEVEIRVLLAEHKLSQTVTTEQELHDFRFTHRWAAKSVEASGLEFVELVENGEAGLMQKRLLSERMLSDGSSVNFVAQKGRLTNVGMALCDLMMLSDDPIGTNFGATDSSLADESALLHPAMPSESLTDQP